MLHNLPPPVAGYHLSEDAHARLGKLERRLKLLAALACPDDAAPNDARLSLSREALFELFSDLADDCRSASAGAKWAGSTLDR